MHLLGKMSCTNKAQEIGWRLVLQKRAGGP